MITVKKLLDVLAYQVPQFADPDNGYTKMVNQKFQEHDTEGMINLKGIEEAKQFKDDFLAGGVKVTVFDAVMGTGKSSGTIDYALLQDVPMIILVELSSEIDRYLESLKGFANFTSPKLISDDTGERKRDVLQRQVEQRANIITTHALFESWSKETLRHIELHGYVLILDEVHTGIYDTHNISSNDLEGLLSDGYLKVDHKGVLQTTDKNIFERYYDLSNTINTKKCHLLDGEKKAVIKELNPDLFTAFKNIVVLTYMFEGSLLKSFFELNHIEYHLQSFDIEGNVVDYHEPDGSQFRKLIHFEGTKNNTFPYRSLGALSKSWFDKSKKVKPKGGTKTNFDTLKGTAANIARGWTNSGIDKECIAWTTRKDFALALSDSRFDNKRLTEKKVNGVVLDDDEISQVNFISQTVRGTNVYKHKTHLLYLTNLFPNTVVSGFINAESEGRVRIDVDAYALANVLQWLWRSAIRDGHEITVFIPAQRPRQLLMKWLGYTDDELY